ncbi:MAG: HDIG domain-containing protein [Nitrospirae bacterium]|nr:HDIG domain-containing protein [Nitrospirota bacterium]
MPKIQVHAATSAAKTGKDYMAVHEWLDSDPDKKAERHDVAKVRDNGKLIEAQYGEEGRREFIRHIVDDLTMTGISEADIGILRREGVSEDDIAHCVKVAEKAAELAVRTGAPLDMELVCRGALFHDLGKAKTHAMEHGKLGAEMGAALGLPKSVTDVMEKHIRGGLTAAEAVELGLPVKDYTLGLLEERIIIYADRLVDIITEDVVDIGPDEREAERRFEEILRAYPKYGKNETTLGRYVGYHNEIQGLMA